MFSTRKAKTRTTYAIVAILVSAVLMTACGGGGAAAPTTAAGIVPTAAAGLTQVAPTTAVTAAATAAATQAGTSAVPSTGGTAAATGAATTAATAAATTAATTAATAAGPTAQPTPTATLPVGTPQPGEIRMAVVRGAMMDTMRKIVAKYEAANPGKKVTLEEEPEGGAYDALIAAGNQPDIITVSFGTQIGHYASTGVVIPMEGLDGAQQIFAKLDKATVQKLYGHNYYMPLGADVTVLIYNKDLFTKAGLDPAKPPATWDEFLADAQKIDQLPADSSGAKVHGTLFWNDALTYGGWYWNLLQPIYLNANQDQCQLLNKLGTDIVFDQPQCKMKDFFDFAQKAQKFAPPTMEKDFFSRTIGMWPQYGYSWEPNLKTAAGKPMVIGQDVAVAPVPVPAAGDKSYSTYGGRALMIMKTNPTRQADAWNFVKFMMQDDNNLQFLEELGYLPILSTLKDNAYFKDPVRQPFVQALQTAILPEQYETADKVATAVQGVYEQAVVKGSMTPDQAVQQAAQAARAALK